jgi:hypothetical protein
MLMMLMILVAVYIAQIIIIIIVSVSGEVGGGTQIRRLKKELAFSIISFPLGVGVCVLLYRSYSQQYRHKLTLTTERTWK